MRIPRHIGIIPDGNRRWAKANGLKKEDGYEYGLTPGLKLLREAKKYGVKEITYYGFTVDNCKRPKEQVKAFQEACVEAVKMIEKEDVSLLVIGNTESECFPKELLAYTKRGNHINQEKIRVNFLVNYGWEWDLNDGVKSKEVSRIDMIIRWGGMCRLSGFLPVQSVYADFYIIKDLWPDFKEEQFANALAWYQKQDVTLGG
ncbi:undecaprenyl diphosphate synthase family protein [Anaerosacchariphilus polymeriproducens]|uniref:Undecaprenyl diphosphate synthase family protein n=1 Tax=Anaerosacchariphilus polymeriproducens TaxID=1812858 RepID=A0A371AWC9_9FIRM|nr:undecaprenyl diphosphate synthase family protein [Anaerosacchariphilus polymeriproducens]RDU23770.1 undecaprenyl diphosphate synthase family protein [Anaerosacchariphilus polymeriproducens]